MYRINERKNFHWQNGNAALAWKRTKGHPYKTSKSFTMARKLIQWSNQSMQQPKMLV